MQFKDYYQTMGVPRGATQDEIKRAYRKLARKYHPDVSKERDADARFKEVGEAYEVLKDPEKRAAYDRLGSNWKAGQEFQPPPDWSNRFEFPGGGFTGRDASAFSDFFEMLYGRGFGAEHLGGASGSRSRSAAHAHGHDQHAKVVIDLEDSFTGATRTISLQVPGLDAEGHATTRQRKLNVQIPRGVCAGQQIRLSGQGAAGVGGGKGGDLYLEIAFHPHPHFRSEQRDIYLDLAVAPWEAALGAQIEVPSPGGPLSLKVPAGSANGGKLRLKGRGIPGRAGGAAGDFYVVLQLALPPATGDKAKAFYRDMAAHFHDFKPRAKLELAT